MLGSPKTMSAQAEIASTPREEPSPASTADICRKAVREHHCGVITSSFTVHGRLRRAFVKQRRPNMQIPVAFGSELAGIAVGSVRPLLSPTGKEESIRGLADDVMRATIGSFAA